MTEIFGSKQQPELHTNGIFRVLLFTWFLLTRNYLWMQNFKDVSSAWRQRNCNLQLLLRVIALLSNGIR